MAGHSKWSNIKHRKERQDAKRGKYWSKCSRAIIAAARSGGGDPDMNLTLRYAIDEARYANMPKENIERAIKKGAGAGAGESYESARYEGYGPGGVAILVDTLTDNGTRTVNELRSIFNKGGGNLGSTGCVGYMFDTLGLILVDAKDVDEEKIMDAAIEAGADDVAAPEPNESDNADNADNAGFWTITTTPSTFQTVKAAMEQAGYTITEAQIAMVPQTTLRISGEDARKLINLIDAIEDNDDAQKVYTNADIADED
ncbi:YebC/PmpR family DNA-binding transcriptional regulator [Roseiflexus sp. AH-315-K22]|nr:YebC/PmpR family DNA-binding transcriptional regulator [Roseiflexus sp. AH-315-K22]